jgi:cation diffusion facilitator family transporter
MTREKEIYKVTLVGSAGNVALLTFKFIAGFLGHSSAMIADAVHSLSDFVTDLVVLVFVSISAKPQDQSHDYGHGKFETIATFLIGLALIGAATGIIVSGGMKLIAWWGGDELEAPGWIALWAALLSIAVKELLYQYTVRKGRQLDSQVMIANAWHHRSDALSSIGAAVGIGFAILLGHQWVVLDPIAAVVVSFFIMRTAYQLIRQALDELLEKSLPDDVENEIVTVVENDPVVSEVHHLRTRRIGNNIAIEMHVRMPGNISLYESHCHATEIEKRLRSKFGSSTHIGLHVEPVKVNGGYQKPE